MGLRREIVFALAVAVAGVEHRAGGIDAEMIDLVLRPAAAAGGAFEQMLGGELAAGAVGDHVALEIGLAAEQPEAVLDLPVDGDAGVGSGRLRAGRGVCATAGVEADRHGEEGGRSRKRQCDAWISRGQCSFVALSLRRK